MIIPINNGRTITPIYIPQPVVTSNRVALEQSNSNVEFQEPTLADWFVLAVILIFLIVFVVYFINLLKYFFGGEE